MAASTRAGLTSSNGPLQHRRLLPRWTSPGARERFSIAPIGSSRKEGHGSPQALWHAPSTRQHWGEWRVSDFRRPAGQPNPVAGAAPNACRRRQVRAVAGKKPLAAGGSRPPPAGQTRIANDGKRLGPAIRQNWRAPDPKMLCGTTRSRRVELEKWISNFVKGELKCLPSYKAR